MLIKNLRGIFMLEIRVANVHDAQELAIFAERTFRETFERDNSPEDMAMYTSQTFGMQKQASEISDPRRRTTLAFLAGELAGYCQLLNGVHDPSVKGAMVLTRFGGHIRSVLYGVHNAQQKETEKKFYG
jgi:hypothetical protein